MVLMLDGSQESDAHVYRESDNLICSSLLHGRSTEPFPAQELSVLLIFVDPCGYYGRIYGVTAGSEMVHQ